MDAERKRAAELKVSITQLDAVQNYCLLHARQLDAMAPPSAGVKPLTPEEIIAYDNLRNTYGPNMMQWLRAVFGPTSTIAADANDVGNWHTLGNHSSISVN